MLQRFRQNYAHALRVSELGVSIDLPVTHAQWLVHS